MVSEITALLGSEKATIVVANALRLNGGMIAAAHKAEDGTYSDHGLLTLRVGEFFVQHIHDYDDGYTLGAAIASDSFAPTVGGHKVSGTTFATVGKGNIECTKTDGTCQIDNARRDVTLSQEHDTEYNVTPITAYIPLGAMPTLPRTPDGKLDWKTMAENVHAQTFGAAATVLKLAGKPFGLWDQPADEKQAQELKKALDAARAEYDKLSDDEKKIADQYQEKGYQTLNEQLAEIHEIASDDKSTDKDTTATQQFKLAKVAHIAAEGLRKLGSEYVEFEQKYPNLARFGMSGLNVLVQSLVAGVPGLVNAAKSEMIGFGISMSLASQMNSALQSASNKAFEYIKEKVPDLSDEDARTLATATTVGLAFAWAGAMQARQLMRQLGSLKMAATSAGKVGSSVNDLAKGSGEIADDLVPNRAPGANLFKSFDDIITNPYSLFGKSADEVCEILGTGWTKGAYGSKGTGWKFIKGDQSIFYHPGGGRHGGAYYGFSSAKVGKIRLLDRAISHFLEIKRIL